VTQNTIYVRASRADMRQAIAKIPEVARGGGAIANKMMVRCGMSALRRIREAFVIKARGGTDETGEVWKPLAKSTIAYSRRQREIEGDPSESRVFSHAKNKLWVPKSKGRAGYRPSYALTDEQNEQWWEEYSRGLAMYHGNKGRAAARAWIILKMEGAHTLMEIYGDMKVYILRSTGLLLNSLSPGVASGEQVFRVGRGEVIVGTNRKWAGVHHYGSRNGRIPQRRLWPPVNRWPSSWWIDLLEQVRMGLTDIAVSLLRH